MYNHILDYFIDLLYNINFDMLFVIKLPLREKLIVYS